jgi:hypothetical protein
MERSKGDKVTVINIVSKFIALLLISLAIFYGTIQTVKIGCELDRLNNNVELAIQGAGLMPAK